MLILQLLLSICFGQGRWSCDNLLKGTKGSGHSDMLSVSEGTFCKNENRKDVTAVKCD